MFKKFRQYIIFLCFVWVPAWAQNPVAVLYDDIHRDPTISLYFPDTTGDSYLRQLRDENQLINLTNNCTTDKEKVLVITDWVHNQWAHDGNNTPSKGDALTILKEARKGRRFRCVEFGTVLASSLMSLGYKARQVGLQTSVIETARYGASHVIVEVWLPS